MRPVIGVLALQGAIEEHLAMTKLAFKDMGIDGEIIQVKKSSDVGRINGLIIPGGESTTIGRAASMSQLLQLIKQRISEGMPVLGTCAGLILLAKSVYDRVLGKTEQPIIGLMDVVVERNAFGRQRDSFEADLDIPIIGDKKFKGVFIRAPAIREIGPNVEVLCKLGGVIVAVMQDNIIGTSFHPELTNDSRIHQLLIKKVRLL
ncbi:MAG: pyridoxal 5'-phosphate synthase glutaminase subunit PdxT [Candidatus Methanomethyliaceae archaeon]|nr:pyridoxal 5'-phosphate synthase glutaminase subunit PdxT [Candidatus Methanomethyliaceae archaeon]MDW7971008.1 pyridoxal 5'-phosphate synthase glutaminase subunit PdxT [Nitrososphaerota archaeon]